MWVDGPCTDTFAYICKKHKRGKLMLNIIIIVSNLFCKERVCINLKTNKNYYHVIVLLYVIEEDVRQL